MKLPQYRLLKISLSRKSTSIVAEWVDFVTCGECKYCVNGQCWASNGLDKLDGNVADDDFCSRGERRE